jgi:5-bromo-4-chloroindolyl phosphate hydrolysis protein
MKNYLFPVYVVTGFLLIYIVSIQVNIYLPLIMFMFSISPLLLIWMVYKVLTAEVKVKSTFEEKWYEDKKGKN